MEQESVQIRRIWQQDERTLAIAWTDGKESLYDVVELRRQCPCAVCVDEITRERKIKPEDVPQSLRPVVIESVGRYAMNIQFSDGHRTGIYSYKLLRSLA
ncbi:MAG: DUF971 domain-containing protein [Oligoflexus sp.]